MKLMQKQGEHLSVVPLFKCSISHHLTRANLPFRLVCKVKSQSKKKINTLQAHMYKIETENNVYYKHTAAGWLAEM